MKGKADTALCATSVHTRVHRCASRAMMAWQGTSEAHHTGNNIRWSWP